MSNLSFVEHIADGSTAQFAIAIGGENIGYFRSTDIHAYVDGAEVSFTINPASPHLIVLDAIPASGSTVLIRRIMPEKQPYANFERGNNFGHRQVNNSFVQQLYLTQQILDGFRDESYYEKQNLNMGNYKVIGLDQGTQTGDAVEYDQWLSDKTTQDNRLSDLEQSITAGNLVYRRVTFTAEQDQTEFYPNARFVGVLGVYINGIHQIAGEGYVPVDGTFIMTVPLDEGDRVVAVIGEEPQFATPVQTDLRYVRYPMYAIGGETKMYIPVRFEQIMSAYINGIHQTHRTAYEYDVLTQEITFAEPLEGGDEIVVYLGEDPLTVDPTVGDNITVTADTTTITQTLKSWMLRLLSSVLSFDTAISLGSSILPLPLGVTVTTKGWHEKGDTGQATYTVVDKTPEVGDIPLVNGHVAELQLQPVMELKSFGLVRSSDNTAMLNDILKRARYRKLQHSAGWEINSGTIEVPPNTHLKGAGITKSRWQFTGTAADAKHFTPYRPAGYSPALIQDVTIEGFTFIGYRSGSVRLSVCFHMEDVSLWRIDRNEIALYNKAFQWGYERASSLEATPEQYFNSVRNNKIASCNTAHEFNGATNRNDFLLNTYTNCLLVFDYSNNHNWSETNSHINENLEGCHNVMEHGVGVSAVYKHSYINMTVENPSTNSYTCTFKDPGRQEFIGLSIIPSNDAQSVDFYTLAGRTPSLLLGSRGSSSGFSYGFRITEPLQVYEPVTYLGEICSGSASINVTLAENEGHSFTVSVTGNKDAQVGDFVEISLGFNAGAVVHSGYVNGVNSVYVRIQNVGSAKTLTGTVYAVVKHNGLT